jgi:hypothetical protein
MVNPKLDLQLPIKNAIDFFEDSSDLDAILWLDVIYRRFGVLEFADALERYDQLLGGYPKETQSQFHIFRRIADRDNVFQTTDLTAASSELDSFTIPALYCDQFGLPEDYSEILVSAADLGGYHLTHVLLAWIWIQENGCELVLPDGFIEDVYFANAALVNDDHVVNDIELEAAAFLYLAGHGTLVDSSFIEQVVTSQNKDGGWAFSGEGKRVSHAHSTILGLLLLLHVEFPSDSYPPVLDST